MHNIEPGAVVLDTEATDLNGDIIEIAVVEVLNGDVLLDTLVYSDAPVHQKARAAHRITDAEIEAAPRWDEIEPAFQQAVAGRDIYIYNAAFDLGRLAAMFGGTLPDYIDPDRCHCVMLDFAAYYGDWDDYRRSYRWQRLTWAAHLMEVDVDDLTAHRAVADCEMTRRVMLAYFPERISQLEYQQNEEAAERALNQARRKQREAKRQRVDKIRAHLLPDGIDLVTKGKDRYGLDRSGKKWPYYGSSSRPIGAVTLSKVTLSTMGDYEYLGVCVNTYGGVGHLVKKKAEL